MRKSAPKNQRITWLNAPLVTDKKPPPANESQYIISTPAHNARTTRKSSRGRSDTGVAPVDSTADPSAEQTSRKRAHSIADAGCDTVTVEQNDSYEFECEHGCGFDGTTMHSVETHERKCAQNPDVQLGLSRIQASIKSKTQKNTEKRTRQRVRKQGAPAAAAAVATDADANGGEGDDDVIEDGGAALASEKDRDAADYTDYVGSGSTGVGSDGGGVTTCKKLKFSTPAATPSAFSLHRTQTNDLNKAAMSSSIDASSEFAVGTSVTIIFPSSSYPPYTLPTLTLMRLHTGIISSVTSNRVGRESLNIMYVLCTFEVPAVVHRGVALDASQNTAVPHCLLFANIVFIFLAFCAWRCFETAVYHRVWNNQFRS